MSLAEELSNCCIKVALYRLALFRYHVIDLRPAGFFVERLLSLPLYEWAISGVVRQFARHAGWPLVYLR
jgi:hypothetical protein